MVKRVKFGRAYIASVLALVLSTSVFNAPGIVLVVPIIQGGDTGCRATLPGINNAWRQDAAMSSDAVRPRLYAAAGAPD